jgi:hypothetical protein
LSKPKIAVSPTPLAKPPGTGIAVFITVIRFFWAFGGSREAAEVVGGGGDREGGNYLKDEDFKGILFGFDIFLENTIMTME